MYCRLKIVSKEGKTMGATSSSGLGGGSIGDPQTNFDELGYELQAEENETNSQTVNPPTYLPSPKHEPGGWGSENPIKSNHEGQQLLNEGYPDGKQIYNVTEDGIIVKFQPDNTPYNTYHAYQVSKPRDIPPSILKQMLKDNKITRADYNRIRTGKK